MLPYRKTSYICPVVVLKVIMGKWGIFLSFENIPYHEITCGQSEQNSHCRGKWPVQIYPGYSEGTVMDK